MESLGQMQAGIIGSASVRRQSHLHEGNFVRNQDEPTTAGSWADKLVEGSSDRLESLRRKREDLLSAAAAPVASARSVAAVAGVSLARSEPGRGPDGTHVDEDDYSTTGKHIPNDLTGMLDVQSSKKEAGRQWPGARATSSTPRRRGDRGERGERQADEVEADQVAGEISSMAARLKESSMAVNQTLRAQTQVLEETGQAATSNVDRVQRENARVAERLRKKRAAMCASWCMIMLVIVTFFTTYILVILPFEKRRGPFVSKAHSKGATKAKEKRPRMPVKASEVNLENGDGKDQRLPEEKYKRQPQFRRNEQQVFSTERSAGREQEERIRKHQSRRGEEIEEERQAAEDMAPSLERYTVDAQLKRRGAGDQMLDKVDDAQPESQITAEQPVLAVVGEAGRTAEISGGREHESSTSDEDDFRQEARPKDESLGQKDAPLHDTTAPGPAPGELGTETLQGKWRHRDHEAHEGRSRTETDQFLPTRAGLRFLAEDREEHGQHQSETLMQRAEGTRPSRQKAPTEVNSDAEGLAGSTADPIHISANVLRSAHEDESDPQALSTEGRRSEVYHLDSGAGARSTADIVADDRTSSLDESMSHLDVDSVALGGERAFTRGQEMEGTRHVRSSDNLEAVRRRLRESREKREGVSRQETVVGRRDEL